MRESTGAKKPFHKVEPEHRFESRILRGAETVQTQGGVQLDPVFGTYPFQFPTQRTEEEDARFLDVLMAGPASPDDSLRIPWAVELKVPKDVGGHGENLRHAITQAVLYREYIRTASAYHSWLRKDVKLDATRCQGMVAIPEVKSKGARKRLDESVVVGRHFGVEFCEVV